MSRYFTSSQKTLKMEICIGKGPEKGYFEDICKDLSLPLSPECRWAQHVCGWSARAFTHGRWSTEEPLEPGLSSLGFKANAKARRATAEMR